MSAETSQGRTPGIVPEDHLDTSPVHRETITADPERHEFYCTTCTKRVTRSSTSGVEYGHARTCDYHLFEGKVQ